MTEKLPDKDGFFVYMVESSDGSLYTGYTNDLEKRLTAHNSGKGAKCLRGKRPVKLVWSKGYKTKSPALKEEARIKSLTREQKKELVKKYREEQKEQIMAKKIRSGLSSFPLAEVFHIIEPGPLVMVTTTNKGQNNVMTMSWHMMMDFEPPLIGCVLSSANYSFKALRATKECVIAVPAVDLAAKAVDVGNCSGKDVDKFAKFGLTQLKAGKVKAPLIAECLFNLECRVVNTTLVNKYEFFVLEAVKAWENRDWSERRMIHAIGNGTFVVDGRTLDLKKRMIKFQSMV